MIVLFACYLVFLFGIVKDFLVVENCELITSDLLDIHRMSCCARSLKWVLLWIAIYLFIYLFYLGLGLQTFR